MKKISGQKLSLKKHKHRTYKKELHKTIFTIFTKLKGKKWMKN